MEMSVFSFVIINFIRMFGLNFVHHVFLHFIEDEGSIGNELHCRDGIQYLLLAGRFYEGDSSWPSTMSF
jgi:hypothetical protein